MDCKSGETCSDNVYSPIGTVSVTTDASSTGTASGLMILSSGIFEFSSTYESWGVTKYTTSSITNYVKSISKNVTPSSNYYTYFEFSVKVDLTGDDDAIFILSVTISISDTSGGTLSGDLSETVSTGTHTFSSLYYALDGDYDWSIYTNSGSVSLPHSITIQKSVIIMTIIESIDSSDDLFTVSISIKDTAEGTLESSYSHSIVLSLVGQEDGTTPQSGTIWTYSEPQSTSSGTLSFENLKILSSGTFIIKASSSGLEDAESIVYDVKNKVKTIKITTTYSDITTYMNFDVKVCLFGEDDKDFLLDATITLTADPDIGTTDPKSASSSCATFTVYTSIFSNIVFSATTNKDIEEVTCEDLTVVINKPKLKITFKSDGEEVFPKASSEIFGILVEVYDLSFTNVLTLADGIVIKLENACTSDETISCSGLGLTSVIGDLTLSSGSVLLENTQILSSGVFIFTASKTDFISYEYETEFIENTVDGILIKLPEASFYTYFNYDIEITLTGEDGEDFLLQTEVTIVNYAGGISKIVSNTGATQTVTLFFTLGANSDHLSVSTSPYEYSSSSENFQVSSSIIVLDIPSYVIFI